MAKSTFIPSEMSDFLGWHIETSKKSINCYFGCKEPITLTKTPKGASNKSKEFKYKVES